MEWKKINEISGYHVWMYEDNNGKRVYNVTLEDKEPDCEGGYFNLQALLKLKGIR
jgi:hypothetical protein